MRNLIFVLCLSSLFTVTDTLADRSPLNIDFQISIDRYDLQGLTLGDDVAEERLFENEFEFEISLEYLINDNFYVFFTGAYIDETETIDPAGKEKHKSGLERKELGLGYFFGKQIKSELNIGRMDFVSASEWWQWWDEELDAISLQSYYKSFETLIAIAKEQARESTADNFIDPEIDGVQRLMFSLTWEFASDQSLILYYLDQTDNSRSFNTGEFEDADKIDESDADLSWIGLSYLADFDVDNIGEIEVELHVAEVSGKETVYEFDDPSAGVSEVAERTQYRVNGSGWGYWLSWSPALLDNWSIIVGNAIGSGDSNLDDNKNKSFRPSGLQGDIETLGKLYEPSLSNLEIDLIGIEWEITDGVEIALLNFQYQLRELAEEIGDASIELDLTGSSRDLGRETDLVLNLEVREGLEILLTIAEFHPGKAYPANKNQSSTLINFELEYEF